jgi:hypothetical protein
MATQFTLDDCLVPYDWTVRRDTNYQHDTHPVTVKPKPPKHECRTCCNRECKRRFRAVCWLKCEKWKGSKTTKEAHDE